MAILSYVVISILVIFFVLLIASTSVQAFWRVPFIPTPKPIIDGMLDLADLQPNQVVYDLGAGDGRILFAAEKRQPTIRGIGYEGAIGVWLLAKIRIFMLGSKIDMRCEDFTKINFSDADVIFTYLSMATMKKLKPKFDAELKNGAKVVTHAFRVPEMQPEKEKMVAMPMGKGSTVYSYVWRKKS